MDRKKKRSEIHLKVRQKTHKIVGRKPEIGLRMEEAAVNLLASLTAEQPEIVTFPERCEPHPFGLA